MSFNAFRRHTTPSFIPFPARNLISQECIGPSGTQLKRNTKDEFSFSRLMGEWTCVKKLRVRIILTVANKLRTAKYFCGKKKLSMVDSHWLILTTRFLKQKVRSISRVSIGLNSRAGRTRMFSVPDRPHHFSLILLQYCINITRLYCCSFCIAAKVYAIEYSLVIYLLLPLIEFWSYSSYSALFCHYFNSIMIFPRQEEEKW